MKRYTGPNLLQIAMPIGALGGGCICLNGSGGIQDFSIRNVPANSALPDDHTPKDGGFALLHMKLPSGPVTRLVEGPMPPEKIYDQGLKGQGYRGTGHEGLPRFEKAVFDSEYPFGHVEITDPKLPIKAIVHGWSPFIPLDDKNTSIPCAILEYELINTSSTPVDYEFSYHLSHLVQGDGDWKGTRNRVIDNTGIFFHNTDPATHPRFGSATLTVIGHKPLIKGMWMRNGWFNALTGLWREISEGKLRTNQGTLDREYDGPNGGSILMSGRLEPGKSITYPIVITWYFPNCEYEVGGLAKPTPPPDIAAIRPPAPADFKPKWRPYYVSQWKDAADVSFYVHKNFASLRSRTTAFAKALHSSTLPDEVLDAVTSNLGLIKSPTILRQENGNLWGWEGCFNHWGCCYGSCTHVWNYAQAIPHLFPKLERTLRAQELQHSMNDRGHVSFRSALPDGPAPHNFHAAADGQLGGVMKVYRDWQISGDRDWLKQFYPLAKQSIDFCIGQWDPDHRGALFEPHHNTFDIEFWGPDGMCGSVYLGALAAIAAMAEELGHTDDAAAYRQLGKLGADYHDKELFNGEYFHQKVMWKELKDQSFVEQLKSPSPNLDPDIVEAMQREGPIYQYGDGCISDCVIGAWMARIYGIETPQNLKNIRSTLQAIFKYNFKSDLSDHACTERPGYGLGHEASLIICTWPHGNRPTLPMVYSDETWTGFQYQVASHMIEEGMIEEGLTIVRAIRDRFEGHVRNPFNEYECGNYYARNMASYALLHSLSGFRYSAPTRTLTYMPKLLTRPFRTFFSTETGWGVITLQDDSLNVDVIEGSLAVDTARVSINGREKSIPWKRVIQPGKPEKLPIDLQ